MNDAERESEESKIEVLPGQEDIFSFLQSAYVPEVIPEPEAEPPVQEQAEDEPGFLQMGDGQLSFVDPDEWWKEHWVGMPEFIQDDLEPWKSMYIHFATREDMDEFSKLVGQRLTNDTRSIWYPTAEIGRMSDKVFINE